MDKRLNFYDKLKQQQFIETEEEFKILIDTLETSIDIWVNIKLDFENVNTFWSFLTTVLNRNNVCKFLGISNPTYYALDRYFITGKREVVSQKLINRVELFYNLLRWYVNE